jgi:phenylalanyl-tRNA synthetase beta chain
MKVPYRWLQELVPVDLPPRELGARLTSAGLEAEKYEEIGGEWDKVFVGEVLAVSPHPDADRLVLADVDAGEHHLTVVTGAPNIAQGQKVALAIVGARLIDAYADELKYKTLKPGSIRGVRSEGMVCSEKELGISDEHEGILVLAPDAPVGVPLKDYLGDTVIEFEITPNLVHAFSVVGIAREAAAITNKTMTMPPVADLSSIEPASDTVRIDAPDLCPRYSAIVIDGVSVAPSPDWMTRRLTAAGLRPVNNLVDITNYVMLELGQPLHAFDIRDLAGERIVVRRAAEGERIETLDHQQRTLTTNDLLITDGEKPVAVAGVMGGVNSEVKDDTTSILFESASFDMLSVRHTARALKLRTDASARFERGLDPELVWQANLRAAQLVLELCPGATVRTWQDVYPSPVAERTVSLPVSRIAYVVGMEYPREQILDVLTRLGFAPRIESDALTVTVPTWRSDVTIPEDVIEEVARIVGYDTLPATLITGETPHVERDPMFLLERDVRDALVATGTFEARTYSTVSDQAIARWSATETGGLVHAVCGEQVVHLRNPIRADEPNMRVSIVPRLIECVAENLKHEKTVRLFETGHVFIGTESDALPNEPATLGMAWAGFRDPFDRFNTHPGEVDQIDFFDVKGAIELALARVGLTDLAWDRHAHPALHPGRTATVSVKGECIGVVGEVRPDLARELGVEDVRLVIAEVDLAAVLALRAGAPRPVITVDRFLPVEQDFAVVVDRETPAAQVEAAFRKNAGPLLTDLVLFDVFEGEQIGTDKKSLAFRLTFTAPDRALTDAELGKVRKRIERGLTTEVGGALRA